MQSERIRNDPGTAITYATYATGDLGAMLGKMTLAKSIVQMCA